jgi:hypothetical protein
MHIYQATVPKYVCVLQSMYIPQGDAINGKTMRRPQRQEGKRTYVFKGSHYIPTWPTCPCDNMTRTIEEMHNTNKEKCGLRFFRLELIYQTESIYAHRYQERLFVLPSPLHVACSVWCFSSYTEIGNAQLSPCWERASINVGKAIKVIFTCWLLLFLNIGIFGAICSIWYWVLGTRR